MALAHINGTDIRFEDSGGDGPALLFSHGFMMDHTMFDAQVDALADDYRCVRWDERGFGDTHAPGEFTYWDSADDAIGLLDHLGIDQAVLIGMSQGGFLSLRAALAHPGRVRALVLIDSAADLDDDETLNGNQAMMHVLENGTEEEQSGVRQIVAGMILGDDALAAEWIPKWEAMDLGQLALAGQTLLTRDDISDRVGEITCPILNIHGTADIALDISRARAIGAAAVDHRGLVEIEGAAHAPNMTDADQVNAAIADFLAAL
jgi:pimeloyl-ACP methyl ester carboxylesterase